MTVRSESPWPAVIGIALTVVVGLSMVVLYCTAGAALYATGVTPCR